LTDTETDERQLIEAAQADPARFVELYDRHFHRVWAYVSRRHGNRAEAEDFTSEVFRKALEALPAYEWRATPFAAWLLRIARNTLAHHWEKARPESPMPPEFPELDADPERHALLFQLVDRLPEAQRQLIEMRYIEGLNLAEAGHRLGKTEGAAKQLHRRALEQLRAQLLPAEGEESSNV
jgi:RNA polymerase sigma-70 factor, ECF subfamily